MRIRAKSVAQTGALLTLFGADAVELPKVETMTSFAAKPVTVATDIFQSNPSGRKNGSINFPMLPATLSPGLHRLSPSLCRR